MLTGSCLCRAVRYEIRGAPLAMYYCHCALCRKSNGAMAATNLWIGFDDFSITAGRESLAAYESSPAKHRYFCAHCGSPVYSHGQGAGHVALRGGTLDGDPGLRPQFHVHVASKASWTVIDDGLPQYAGVAPFRPGAKAA